MDVFNFDLDEAVEDRLFTELERDGLTSLDGVVGPDLLAACRTRTDALIEERGHRYFSVVQPQQAIGQPYSAIADHPGFRSLMRNLVRRAHSEKAVAGEDLYCVLRVIAGPDAATRAFEFHYDATVLTVLLPLFIPGGAPDKAGDLVAMPNRRRYRRSSLTNIGEKILLQNRIAYKVYARRYGRGTRNVVKLRAGNLYFFWGYRTLHGNLPCEAGQKRATLLFHLGNPHAGDMFTRGILKLRRFREDRRLNAG